MSGKRLRRSLYNRSMVFNTGRLPFALVLASQLFLAVSAFAQTDAIPDSNSSPVEENPADVGPTENESQPSHGRSPGPLLGLAELEQQGAVIGNIEIVTVNVFDPADPADNKSLFRLANRLHIRSKPQIIRQQLLFKSGEPLSLSKIHETERLLRGNRYLVEAQVTPVREENGVVDLLVRTQDVWTLNPGINLSRSGGKSSYSFYVQDSNLLGYGKDVSVEYANDVDRSTSSVRYSDPRLFGSWNQLLLAHSDNSDGTQSLLALSHPFYSLNSRWSGGVSGLDWSRIDTRYNLGEIVDQYRHEQRAYQTFYGLSSGLNQNGTVRRWTLGLSYSDDRFAPDPNFLTPVILPQAKKIVAPFLGFELLQDRFEQRRNEAQIGRTEDLYTGKYLQAILGVSASALSSDRNALMLGFAAGSYFESQNKQQGLTLATEGAGRIEHRQLVNATLTLNAESYWRLTAHQVVFGSVFGALTHDLDSDRQLLLGGDFAGLSTGSIRNPSAIMPPLRLSQESLRGYPLRYQDGSALGLFTLEHRIYTDAYLFRLFRLGGAVFFDAGRTWGRGTAGGESLGWLKDVGLGLRFGSTRSAFGNVIHVDLAFPLDGDRSIDSVQFLIQTKRSF